MCITHTLVSTFRDTECSINLIFKVSIRPTGFLWFWYLYNILKCIQARKMNSNAFLP